MSERIEENSFIFSLQSTRVKKEKMDEVGMRLANRSKMERKRERERERKRDRETERK